VFQAVRVDATIDVFNGMIDNLMHELFFESAIGHQRVSFGKGY
jgi:hypothetical protein